jgi:hypothetical protein
MTSLTDDLTALHDRYVEAVNLAVAADDLVRADRLASEYCEEATLMIAEREGRADLPIRRAHSESSGLRALVRRLTAGRAA